jgi:branched-chain amino acid transport system ATP-binding protein
MLQVEKLECIYGGSIKALSGVSIIVNDGEIVSLLGANGAGKTTTLRCVIGQIVFSNGKIADGTIQYNGRSLTSLLPFEITKLGISLVPEERKLFIDMTVEENLRIGAYTIKDKRKIQNNYEDILGYFPQLKDLRRRLTGYLSGGEQQMLAVARALMSSPQLLLLDEPSIGLAPKIALSIFDIIAKIRREKKTSMLVVEQNANMALRISDTCFIMESGKTVLEGESCKLKNDPKIKAIYLGIS